MPIVLLSPLLVGSFCQVSRGMDEARTQMQEVKGLLFRIIKQTNKQKLPRRGKTNWLAGQGWTWQDKAGQDKAGPDTDDI